MCHSAIIDSFCVPSFACSVGNFPYFPECLLTTLRKVCSLCWKECVLSKVITKYVFQPRKRENERRTMPQSCKPSCSNFLKLPLNRVIFHMLLAAAPQRYKLWLHWISIEAAYSVEFGISVQPCLLDITIICLLYEGFISVWLMNVKGSVILRDWH